ncbi:MAG: ABC transporter ATP-binding protein [Firmicutes bacterium]|nr:ABC transporter ATP-binding protein [Bacillota bacterium]
MPNPVYGGLPSKLRKEITEKRRKQDQCVRHIISREYLLETRISGSDRYFKNKWEEYRQEIEQEEMNLQLYRLCFELLFNLIKSVCIVAIIVLAVLYMSQGKLSIGAFSAVISILNIMHASFNQLRHLSTYNFA